MGRVPKNPVIYEINTWVWLTDLRARYKEAVTLANVPAKEWDSVATPGVDAIWLMGVWERSPEGTRIARESDALQGAYRRALADFTPEDVVGSPYAVRRYEPEERLGAEAGLAAAREELARRGVKLILDFVPNHVARDHPWVAERPALLVRGEPGDVERTPGEFFEANGAVFAHGRDPHFPPWTDTAQVNAFSLEAREAASSLLRGIAARCDGVRCDMAVLAVNRVFEKTWGPRAGGRPATEYWEDVIGAVHASDPEFVFLAEAYWDMEWELAEQGFDFCYDKRLYDRLLHETADTVMLHLQADPAHQERLVRFVENHDEARAAQAFGPDRVRAAAVAAATVPGARLFFEGQFEGRRVRLPVQLGRRPEEPADRHLRAFYRRLLRAIEGPVFRQGEWAPCDRSGWPDNDSFTNLCAWCWRKGPARRIVVINVSGAEAQGLVHLPWGGLKGRAWRLHDLFSGESFLRNGDELAERGLYVGLPPWGFHVLRCVGV